MRDFLFLRKLIALLGFIPSYCRHRSTEGYLSCVRSVAMVVAQLAGYFEKTVAGKITELWVTFFGLIL